MRNHKKSVVLLFLLLLNFSCASFAKPDEVIYLMPGGFTGGVIIVFNQSDGIAPETDKEGTKIYRVPKDGLIKVKEPLTKLAYQLKYYFVDDKDKRTPIEYLYPKNYVKNLGDTTTRNFDQVTEDESNNRVFASFHETTNFFVGKEKIYIQDFVVERPVNTEKILMATSHRVFDIQRELLKGAKTITGKPQDDNE